MHAKISDDEEKLGLIRECSSSWIGKVVSAYIAKTEDNQHWLIGSIPNIFTSSFASSIGRA